jgi:hypothetical protein
MDKSYSTTADAILTKIDECRRRMGQAKKDYDMGITTNYSYRMEVLRPEMARHVEDLAILNRSQ